MQECSKSTGYFIKTREDFSVMLEKSEGAFYFIMSFFVNRLFPMFLLYKLLAYFNIIDEILMDGIVQNTA